MNYCKWCGREAKHQFKTTKEYCCSKYPQQCPEFKKKLSAAKTGKKRSKESIEKQSKSMTGKTVKPIATKIHLNVPCYICGEQAYFIFKNGKVCCKDDYRKCKGFIKKRDNALKNKPAAKKIINKDKKLCSFGCEKIAEYQFKNGNLCCSEYTFQCDAVKRRLTDDERHQLSELNKKPLSYWIKKYPLFAKIEKPKQTIGGELLVQCKNQNCKKWFTPTYTQLYERIRNIENDHGGGDYFYCSDDCKESCPIFGQKTYYKGNRTDQNSYTPAEYQVFRKFVLERDNYICQYCGKKAEHVHHERPQKLEPFFSLDPDLAWSVCSECHYKYGHKDECSTGAISSKIC